MLPALPADPGSALPDPMPLVQQVPGRLYSLDALRGMAAFAVVFWHWQHFFVGAHAGATDFRPEDQPLFVIFFLFYRSGSLAVDLFFSLSGFIFFWLYSSPISERRISASTFFVLRFSRLYPLHICTLLVVLLGQAAYIEIHQTSFIYPYNDLRHLILNILLLPSVGLERGFSYNAPVWSVSVEVVLYAVFFAYCWFIRARFLHLLGFAALGFLALTHLYQPIGRGAGSFFLGGCVYQVFVYACASKRRDVIAGATGVTAAVLWIATLCFSFADYSLADAPLLLRLSAFFPAAVLFPITILSLALLETRRGPLGKKFSLLGNISYSSYLWHFPLQLAFVLAAPALGATSAFFRSTQSLILFLTLLIALSLLSYRYIEMPAQRRIRQMWRHSR